MTAVLAWASWGPFVYDPRSVHRGEAAGVCVGRSARCLVWRLVLLVYQSARKAPTLPGGRVGA